MVDGTTRARRGGRRRIVTDDPVEMRYWARRFGITERELLDAIRSVGNRADEVEAYLLRRPKSG